MRPCVVAPHLRPSNHVSVVLPDNSHSPPSTPAVRYLPANRTRRWPCPLTALRILLQLLAQCVTLLQNTFEPHLTCVLACPGWSLLLPRAHLLTVSSTCTPCAGRLHLPVRNACLPSAPAHILSWHDILQAVQRQQRLHVFTFSFQTR